MEHHLPVSLVCRVLGAARSTIYARRWASGQPGRPGPAPPIGDEELLRLIRRVLTDSPFAGEGYRKVRARLRREHGVHASGKRVLRLLRQAGLLAPQRARGRRKPRPHDGTIIPQAPNLRWGTDATMAWTRSDGWVWVFAVVDHYTAEAWAHVAETGDRFAALPAGRRRGHRPLGSAGCRCRPRRAVAPRLGPAIPLGALPGLDRLAGHRRRRRLPGRARDRRLRRTLDPHPEGAVPVAELHDTVDQLRQAVACFVETYTTQWLIGRLGHRTPKEAYQDAHTTAAA
jgi:putative transposase